MGRIGAAFSFRGGIGRGAYVLASLAAFFSQHLLVLLVMALRHEPLSFTARLMGLQQHMPLGSPIWRWVNPMLLLVGHNPPLPGWQQILMLTAGLAIGGVLVALAFRRAQSVGGAPMAALAVAPGLQLIAIAWFSLAPSKSASPTEEGAPTRPRGARAQDVAFGLLAGAALSVAAVAVSTLLMGTYGWGLFLGAPFAIGVTTAWLVGRRSNVGFGETYGYVCLSLLLGSLALLTFALEGVICLVMAAPLIVVMALIGALLGRALARTGRRGRDTTMMSIAVIPLLLIGETAAPPRSGFDSVESIEVAASPEAVWQAVIRMNPIPDKPAAPFGWGLAYPIRGEINGAGVGAVRTGVFSTGIAYERVTEWEPGRRLSFDVLSDPPTLRELSPYPNVNAPHLRGYFRTRDVRFTLEPLGPGLTRLTLATRHELDLEPALYWQPFAQWAVHANKRRVLKHFKAQAEAAGA